jgi:hypothetical protein
MTHRLRALAITLALTATGIALLAQTAPLGNPAQYVEPRIGTSNGGNTVPGAVLPFGMLNWGTEEITPDPSPEALEQLSLRYRLAAAAADAYVEAGFSVVLEDVIAGSLLVDYRMMIRNRPCHVIVLLPSAEAVAEREAAREQKGYGAWTVPQLYEGFVSTTPRIGIWLDTTDLTPEQVEAILVRTQHADSG